MAYLALYRKWRPLVFEDVIGQEHVTQTIKNEIKNSRVSHAYLFSGTRGTGKTSTAKIFSRAVNCLHPINGNPCNACENCRGILSNQLLDVVEIDAASNNSVDDIRALRDDVNYSPSGLAYKIYIIDEVHMLSQSAFNALLKTLEEPPQKVIFILATTEIHKIPITILSRCQRFDFKRLSSYHVKKRLQFIAQQEKLTLSDEALTLLSRAADGSMRDALSILDQCVSMEGGEITQAEISRIVGTVDISHLFALTDAIARGDSGRVLMQSDALVKEGRDLSKLCADLISHLRNLLICRTVGDGGDLIDFGFEYLSQYQQSCTQFSPELLMYLIELFTKAQNDMKYAANKRVVLEIAFIRACRPETDDSVNGLINRVQRLEQALQQGRIPASPGGKMQTSVQPVADTTVVASGSKSGLEPHANPPTDVPTVDDSANSTDSVAAMGETPSKGALPADMSNSAITGISTDAAISLDRPTTETNPSVAPSTVKDFETAYWAETVSKINNPAVGSIIFFAKPLLKDNTLYLLFGDSAYLDILHSAGGEQEVQQAVSAVCGQEYVVRAMLQTDYDQQEQEERAGGPEHSQTDAIGDVPASSNRSTAFEELAEKVRTIGGRITDH